MSRGCGRLITVAEEFLGDHNVLEHPDVDANDLMLALIETGDEYLKALGFEFDSFGAYRAKDLAAAL